MPNGEAERDNEEFISEKTGGGKVPKSASPTAAKASPEVKAKQKKEIKEIFAVFAEEDVKNTWPTLSEAKDVAIDAATRHSRPMLVFKLVDRKT